ncbi:TPA: HD family hydrolase, partial [Salmonella enterica]|nr:HD family hydrolase [Salmonella enterica]
MSFIQTLSGKQFDYLSATIDDIDIEDIAVALSNICRFSGHLPKFYSVAQHSVLCSQLVSPEFAFEALMHDAAEAYCQDIPAPLKALLPDYREIEKRTDQLIRFK